MGRSAPDRSSSDCLSLPSWSHLPRQPLGDFDADLYVFRSIPVKSPRSFDLDVDILPRQADDVIPSRVSSGSFVHQEMRRCWPWLVSAFVTPVTLGSISAPSASSSGLRRIDHDILHWSRGPSGIRRREQLVAIARERQSHAAPELFGNTGSAGRRSRRSKRSRFHPSRKRGT